MELSVGKKFIRESRKPNELKIMAIVDKHLMLRYTGCIPFVESIKSFDKFLEKNGLVEKITNLKNGKI